MFLMEMEEHYKTNYPMHFFLRSIIKRSVFYFMHMLPKRTRTSYSRLFKVHGNLFYLSPLFKLKHEIKQAGLCSD